MSNYNPVYFAPHIPVNTKWFGVDGVSAAVARAFYAGEVQRQYLKFTAQHAAGIIEYQRRRHVTPELIIDFNKHADAEWMDVFVTEEGIRRMLSEGVTAIEFDNTSASDVDMVVTPYWRQTSLAATLTQPDMPYVLKLVSSDNAKTVYIVDAKAAKLAGFSTPVECYFRLTHATGATTTMGPIQPPALAGVYKNPINLYVPDGVIANRDGPGTAYPAITQVFIKGSVSTYEPALAPPVGAVMDYLSMPKHGTSGTNNILQPEDPRYPAWPHTYTVIDPTLPAALADFIQGGMPYTSKTVAVATAAALSGTQIIFTHGGEIQTYALLWTGSSTWFVDTSTTWFVLESHAVYGHVSIGVGDLSDTNWRYVDVDIPPPAVCSVTAKIFVTPPGVTSTLMQALLEAYARDPAECWALYEAVAWAVGRQQTVTVQPDVSSTYDVVELTAPYVSGVRWLVYTGTSITPPCADIGALFGESDLRVSDAVYTDVDTPMPPDGYTIP